jgi:hypothetical protein
MSKTSANPPIALKKKVRTQINPKLLSENSFLKEYTCIIKHPSDSCKVRTDDEHENDQVWFYYETLKRHLESSNHVKQAASKQLTDYNRGAMLFMKQKQKHYQPEGAFVPESNEQLNENSVGKTTNSQDYFQFKLTTFLVENTVKSKKAQCR